MKNLKIKEHVKTLKELKKLARKIYGLAWIFGTAKEKTEMIETTREIIAEIKRGNITC